MKTQEKKNVNKEIREILTLAVVSIGLTIGIGIGLLKGLEHKEKTAYYKRIERIERLSWEKDYRYQEWEEENIKKIEKEYENKWGEPMNYRVNTDDYGQPFVEIR